MLPSPDLVFPAAKFWTIALFVFAFGCCVGSYLNVVIYRVPRNMKTSDPKRSFCPACKYQIPFYHNIPILSWLILRGKCANCKVPISARYLFVELLTGLLFFTAFVYLGTEPDGRFLGWDWAVIPAWIFLALAVSGSFIDIDHQILPHRITWGGMVAGLLAAALVPNLIVVDTWWKNLLQGLTGAVLGFAVIWCIVQLGKMVFGRLKMEYEEPVPWSVAQAGEDVVLKVEGKDKVHEETWANIFSRPTDKLIVRAAWALLGTRRVENVVLTMTNDTVGVTPQAGGETETIPLEGISSMSGACTHVEQPREAMGMGDANWMACVGAFFGWKAVLFTVLAGSCIGAVISVLMIILRRREWAARIPFGPYLAAGAVIWMFYGPALLHWYFSLANRGAADGG